MSSWARTIGLGEPCRADHPKRDERASIAEHRVANVVPELMKMLVPENEPNLVLAELGDHHRHAVRGEGLKLIHVKKKGGASFRQCPPG